MSCGRGGSSWSNGGVSQHSKSSRASVYGMKRNKQLWSDLNSLVAEKGPELEWKGWEIDEHNRGWLPGERVEADSKPAKV